MTEITRIASLFGVRGSMELDRASSRCRVIKVKRCKEGQRISSQLWGLPAMWAARVSHRRRRDHFGQAPLHVCLRFLTNTALERITGSFPRTLWAVITESLYLFPDDVAERVHRKMHCL
jgi:hypothetical protein